MFHTRSSEYAVRAAIFLAGQNPGVLVMSKDIAEQTGIPAPFLAKLLQRMTRHGLLRSNKGPNGGFGLAKPAGQVTLLEVLDVLGESKELLSCPLGATRCEDEAGCVMHTGWKYARARLVHFLECTNLAELVPKSMPREM